MSRQVAVVGDSTTTGGRVIDGSGTMSDGGRSMARHGDLATCGTCKGAFLMFGSAERMTDHGQPMVLHGDMILCPCGKNKVLAFLSTSFYSDDPGSQSRSSGSSAPTSQPSATFDEQFTLRHASTRDGLSRVRYRITSASGKVFTGVTDTNGRTQRISTSIADKLKVEIEE